MDDKTWALKQSLWAGMGGALGGVGEAELGQRGRPSQPGLPLPAVSPTWDHDVGCVDRLWGPMGARPG